MLDLLVMHQPSRRTAKPQINHPLTRRTEAAGNPSAEIGEISRRESTDRRTGVRGVRDGQEGKGSGSALSWVNTRRDAIETDLLFARVDPFEGYQRDSDLQTLLAVPTQRPLTAHEYESRPPKICFKILLATGRGRDARGNETIYHFLERIKSHHNVEVPTQHARMSHAFCSRDNWDLQNQIVGRVGAGKLHPFPHFQ